MQLQIESQLNPSVVSEGYQAPGVDGPAGRWRYLSKHPESWERDLINEARQLCVIAKFPDFPLKTRRWITEMLYVPSGAGERVCWVSLDRRRRCRPKLNGVT